MIDFLKHFWIYLDTVMPLLVLLITAFIKFRNPKFSKSDYYIISYLLVQLILNGASNYLSEHDINNQWIFHLNAFISQTIFSIYFYSFLNSSTTKRVIRVVFFMYFCFFVVSILFIQRINFFNSYTFALGSFNIVIYALLGFRVILNELPTKKLYAMKEFWFFTALLTYFGNCFFIFVTYNYISDIAPNRVGVLWLFNNIFLSACCILFFISTISKEWIHK